jgi:hypothetical protein
VGPAPVSTHLDGISIRAGPVACPEDTVERNQLIKTHTLPRCALLVEIQQELTLL